MDLGKTGRRAMPDARHHIAPLVCLEGRRLRRTCESKHRGIIRRLWVSKMMMRSCALHRWESLHRWAFCSRGTVGFLYLLYVLCLMVGSPRSLFLAHLDVHTDMSSVPNERAVLM